MAEVTPDVPQPVAAPDEPRIDLRILSPGQGVPETIEIRDVPTGTQVAKLKERITHVAPSHPASDAQRLIYQGHVLADPSATLQNVFGADAVCLLLIRAMYLC